MTPPDPSALPPDLAAWIGRESRRSDTVTPRLVESFRVTLAPHLAAVAGVPPGLFWCLAPDLAGRNDLGDDGHPRTGLFLPALPFPRRMWAGGELAFHGGFAPGDVVDKSSTVADIVFKTGSTGRLAFVTVEHRYRVEDRLVLSERQDIVYREEAGPGGASRRPPPAEPLAGEVTARTVPTDPTLLFRYSALTFNGHRIHYDEPYATTREGYAGLVVHGPLQATLLLNLAADVLGAVPRRFAYRGLAPLICPSPARLEAARTEGALALRVLDRDGRVTMTATATA